MHEVSRCCFILYFDFSLSFIQPELYTESHRLWRFYPSSPSSLATTSISPMQTICSMLMVTTLMGNTKTKQGIWVIATVVPTMLTNATTGQKAVSYPCAVLWACAFCAHFLHLFVRVLMDSHIPTPLFNTHVWFLPMNL